MNGRVAAQVDRVEKVQQRRTKGHRDELPRQPERHAWTPNVATSLPAEDYAKLLEDLKLALLTGAGSVGILGFTSITLQLINSLTSSGLVSTVETIYTTEVGPKVPPRLSRIPVRPFDELKDAKHDVLVVAADEEKEEFLKAAEPFVTGTPKVIVAGYGHLKFRDSVFREELSGLLVPSLANGYPNSLVHIYQCLQNGARLGLNGVVAEFGMFKGGTTMFMSRVIKRLGMDWQVFGFDTFSGFPPRRHMFDMYDHPDCEWRDLQSVKAVLDLTSNVTVVPGDIFETCRVLEGRNLVLTFFDTDNYTSAKAALEIVREQTVLGGAIVFDHFTGVDRFRYTVGERMAAQTLVDDSRYFNLHGTGVFYRQR